ncbi:MAG: hypothetical protein JRI95_09505 [Deltaproteobacteria bacterium]|nr:hypothetical protein [Deltaproteobacteria bacterium]MBW2086377.1 hypothetical protein [Deltaproteobacteria bacterium]
MNQQSAKESLELARRHLQRVQAAWDEPTDWTDLTLFGFYCLEAAVVAAAEYLGWSIKRSHVAKAEAAERLSSEKGFPEITNLLWELNDARKAIAYGDVPFPNLKAEDVAFQVEKYVEAVEVLIEK